MQLLKDEMIMNMRLIGASNVSELTPDMVDTTGLAIHSMNVPNDTLGLTAYDPLITPYQMLKSKL